MFIRRLILPCLVMGISLAISTSSFAFNIYRVGEEIQGKTFNELLNRWLPQAFSIWVGVDENDQAHLFFKAKTGLGDATAREPNSADVRNKLERAVSKAIEWSDIARKNKADITKGLGCFGNDRYNICEDSSNASDENQMSLTFFASNGGRQTDLIIKVVDQNNQFINATIYVEPPQMKVLLSTIQGISGAIGEARSMASKRNLFK